MKISYSAVQDWRQCQQLYYYRYVENLSPRVQFESIELGQILHKYLELFYSEVKTGLLSEVAHSSALWGIDNQYREELEVLASAAYAVGFEDVAQATVETLDKAIRIANRYYEVRGRSDAEQYEILYCEQYLRYPLDKDIEDAAVIDLITRSRVDGSFQLWEHKAPKNIPENKRRLRDLQVLLYVAMAEEKYEINIDGVVWNYLRSKEPTKPEVLKSTGQLTKRKDLDSTWPVYEQALIEQGISSVFGYEEVYERLEGRELTHFFPRYELSIVQREDILLRDFITTARQIQLVHSMFSNFVPIRNISHYCDFCSFSKLCDAEITGGDVTTIKAHMYKERSYDSGKNNRRQDQEALFEAQ